MGAFGRIFINNYDNDSYIQPKIRIDKCSHCEQITEQKNNPSENKRYLCLNCGTYSDVGKCTCGHCITHAYKKTKYTEKDITNINND